ncbi:hypothetical protein DFA_08702 [Cavenderia fasciculata]|uniref:DUF1289 domain-containing protein n=1 Tax=Cavenderia fasciculata TaxID=261658 RepID=F4Q3V0_CACFS|nr:uncharacterized protein DFA_08702 [Cavenderia fasciculata]EGG17706.1 hypothetical protein DFA_08702 [Cavenderia fasciculata]|eukprot:XP_004356190.1 hypothetical protein DFA_08702 [Cavenderia fasciculata]
MNRYFLLRILQTHCLVAPRQLQQPIIKRLAQFSSSSSSTSNNTEVMSESDSSSSSTSTSTEEKNPPILVKNSKNETIDISKVHIRVKSGMKTPCVDICKMDKAGYCVGCSRNKQEIGGWGMMTDQERELVIEELPCRKILQSNNYPPGIINK